MYAKINVYILFKAVMGLGNRKKGEFMQKISINFIFVMNLSVVTFLIVT